jgi:hypothetical protein
MAFASCFTDTEYLFHTLAKLNAASVKESGVCQMLRCCYYHTLLSVRRVKKVKIKKYNVCPLCGRLFKSPENRQRRLFHTRILKDSSNCISNRHRPLAGLSLHVFISGCREIMPIVSRGISFKLREFFRGHILLI